MTSGGELWESNFVRDGFRTTEEVMMDKRKEHQRNDGEDGDVGLNTNSMVSSSSSLPSLATYKTPPLPPPKRDLRPLTPGGIHDRTFPDHTTRFPLALGQKPADYYEEFSLGGHSSFGGSFTSSYAPSMVEQLKKERKERFEKSKLAAAAVFDPVDYSAPPEINEHERHMQMLGHRQLDKGKLAPYLWREDYCGACGTQHSNPLLLDVYYTCEVCFNQLREPEDLRRKWRGIQQHQPLEVLFATYGDPHNPRYAFDVTEKMQEYSREYDTKDRMVLYAHYRWDRVFGKDPRPGKPKQLKIRYRMDGIYGQLNLTTTLENKFPDRVLLVAPDKEKKRDLKIMHATWGHPLGRSSTGRMSVEVTEVLQGLVDLNGGSYLFISGAASIIDLLGDPCPGYKKDLKVSYDISGREGREMYYECGGHLLRKHIIETCPIVKPMIFIERAFYGVSWTGKRDHLLGIQKKLRRIGRINHRKTMGQLPSAEEIRLVSKYEMFKAEKEAFKKVEISYIDITKKMQTLCDKQGGMSLTLNHHQFDPNAMFGNPTPSGLKLLEVDIVCTGHDSENYTDTREVTVSGYPRNVIPGKNGRFVVACHDLDAHTEEKRLAKIHAKDERKRMKALKAMIRHRGGQEGAEKGDQMMSMNFTFGSTALLNKGEELMTSRMDESVHFETYNGAPMVSVTRALYGHPTDLQKTFSVQNQVQNMVQGRQMVFDPKTKLNELFGDPCPGTRKALKVEYVTRGFTGNLRIREKDGYLVAALELGYAPLPPRDEAAL